MCEGILPLALYAHQELRIGSVESKEVVALLFGVGGIMVAVQGKEAGSGLKLYVDLLSQGCRAIVIFCRANGINAEEVTVSIARGEQRTPEYLSINPLGKVPSIDDGGFKFNESHAILRYLATTRDVADHWLVRQVYPTPAVEHGEIVFEDRNVIIATYTCKI